MPLERSARPRRISTQRSECFFVGFFFVLFSRFFGVGRWCRHTQNKTHKFLFWMLMRLTVNRFKLISDRRGSLYTFRYYLLIKWLNLFGKERYTSDGISPHYKAIYYISLGCVLSVWGLDNNPPTTWLIHFVFLFPVVNMISLLSPLK